MGYRIRYPAVRKLRGRARLRLTALTALFFILFLILATTFWPEGAAWIRNSAPVQAFNGLAWDLFRGDPVVTSFSEFLLNILA